MLSGLGGAVFLAAGRGEFPRVSELLFAGASLPQRAALVAVGAELGDSVLLQGFADPICTIAHNRCSAASGEQDNLATNQATIRDATAVGGVADVPWGGAAGDECGHGESADGQRTASSKEPSIVVVSGEVGPGSSKNSFGNFPRRGGLEHV